MTGSPETVSPPMFRPGASVVPLPSEDEVCAAIYAYRQAEWGALAPDFDSLPVHVRVSIYDDMQAALMAAALVRQIQPADAAPGRAEC